MNNSAKLKRAKAVRRLFVVAVKVRTVRRPRKWPDGGITVTFGDWPDDY